MANSDEFILVKREEKSTSTAFKSLHAKYRVGKYKHHIRRAKLKASDKKIELRSNSPPGTIPSLIFRCKFEFEVGPPTNSWEQVGVSMRKVERKKEPRRFAKWKWSGPEIRVNREINEGIGKKES